MLVSLVESMTLMYPKLESGAGLGHQRRLTRPADTCMHVLNPN